MIMIVCFSLLLLSPSLLFVQTASASLANCPIQCRNSSSVSEIVEKAPLDQANSIRTACQIGCRWSSLDTILSFNHSGIKQCLQSCQDAYQHTEQQLACSVGCKLTASQQLLYAATNETVIVSYVSIVYDVIASPFENLMNWGNTVEVTVVTVQGSMNEDQIQLPGAEGGSTVGTANDDESSEPVAMEIWVILQILCALLLLFSLICCCCFCTGEARSYIKNKKRPRDLINCKEEETDGYKSLTQPLTTPITTYTVPVKLDLANKKVMVQ